MKKELKTGEHVSRTITDHAGTPIDTGIRGTPGVVRVVRKPRLVTVRETRRGNLAVEEGLSVAIREGRMWPTVANDGGKDIWATAVYNSSIGHYGRTFWEVLEEGRISDIVRDRNGALVIDLMGSTRAISDLFMELPRDPQRQGIAVSLTDERTPFERNRDEYLGIDQLGGDLTQTKTWRRLEQEMKGQKADPIMERGLGGVAMLPAHPQFYRYAMQRLWGMVSDNGGTLLLEIPEKRMLGMDLSQWEKRLHEQGIEAKVGMFAVRIVKRPDSPAELPRA